MTSSGYELIAVACTCVTVLVTVSNIIYNRNEKWYKRISLIGYLLIALTIITIYATYEKNNTESNSKEHTTIIEKEKPSVIIRYDTPDIKSNNKGDAIPLLSLLTDKGISFIKTKPDNDTILYKFYLQSSNNMDVYNFKVKLYGIIISHFNGNTKVTTDAHPNSYSFDNILKNTSIYLNGHGIADNKLLPKDSVYFYLTGSYSNYNNTIIKYLKYMIMQNGVDEILICSDENREYVLNIVEKVKPKFIKIEN